MTSILNHKKPIAIIALTVIIFLWFYNSWPGEVFSIIPLRMPDIVSAFVRLILSLIVASIVTVGLHFLFSSSRDEWRLTGFFLMAAATYCGITLGGFNTAKGAAANRGAFTPITAAIIKMPTKTEAYDPYIVQIIEQTFPKRSDAATKQVFLTLANRTTGDLKDVRQYRSEWQEQVGSILPNASNGGGVESSYLDGYRAALKSFETKRNSTYNSVLQMIESDPGIPASNRATLKRLMQQAYAAEMKANKEILAAETGMLDTFSALLVSASRYQDVCSIPPLKCTDEDGQEAITERFLAFDEASGQFSAALKKYD